MERTVIATVFILSATCFGDMPKFWSAGFSRSVVVLHLGAIEPVYCEGIEVDIQTMQFRRAIFSIENSHWSEQDRYIGHLRFDLDGSIWLHTDSTYFANGKPTFFTKVNEHCRLSFEDENPKMSCPTFGEFLPGTQSGGSLEEYLKSQPRRYRDASMPLLVNIGSWVAVIGGIVGLIFLMR